MGARMRVNELNPVIPRGFIRISMGRHVNSVAGDPDTCQDDLELRFLDSSFFFKQLHPAVIIIRIDIGIIIPVSSAAFTGIIIIMVAASPAPVDIIGVAGGPVVPATTPHPPLPVAPDFAADPLASLHVLFMFAGRACAPCIFRNPRPIDVVSSPVRARMTRIYPARRENASMTTPIHLP
jgi:hypothetical protein